MTDLVFNQQSKKGTSTIHILENTILVYLPWPEENVKYNSLKNQVHKVLSEDHPSDLSIKLWFH